MRFMKYLVFTDNFSYLFNEFRHQLRNVEILTKHFYNALKPYVDSGYIKMIPSEEAYRGFVEHYKRENSIDLINKLIMNINLKNSPLNYIKNSCNSEEMLTSLIYLSTKVEMDFVTPLRKMMSYS